MPWYVARAHTLKWSVGGIYSLPHNYSRWTKAVAFYRRVHRTVRRTPEKHCSLSGALPRQPTVGVCSSQPLDLTITHTVWCTPYSPMLQPESAYLRPLCADRPVVPPDSPVHTGQVLCTVRCATRRWLTALFSGFFADFYGLLLFLSLGLLCFFYIFF